MLRQRMPGSPDPTGPGFVSECPVSREIGAVRSSCGLSLDQAQLLFDALDPAIHVVEAHLGRGVVDLHLRQIALDRRNAGRQLAKAGLDAVQPVHGPGLNWPGGSRKRPILQE